MKSANAILLCLFAGMACGPVQAQEASPNASDRTARLSDLLKRYPESDANRDGTLTLEEARAYRDNVLARRNRSNLQRVDNPPTHADVAYGEHEKQRFDLWLVPDSKEPTPLVIYIHGGGFRSGDKADIAPGIPARFLSQGVAFASLNYRLSDVGPYPLMMQDAARGLQTIRHRAKEWNIDPAHIVCYGGSAGAGISLWLAFHDDLAQPDSSDPIARESTRIHAAGTMGGQSSYNLLVLREWFGVPDLPPHSAMQSFYGLAPNADLRDESIQKLMQDASPITHLSKDDRVSVYMTYNQPNTKVTADTPENTWVHHVLLGLKLKAAMDPLQLECHVIAPDLEAGPDPYGSMTEFLIAKAKGTTPASPPKSE